MPAHGVRRAKVVLRPNPLSALVPGLFFVVSAVGLGLLWLITLRAGSASVVFGVSALVFGVLAVGTLLYVLRVQLLADAEQISKRTLLGRTIRVPRSSLVAMLTADSQGTTFNSLTDNVVASLTFGSSSFVFAEVGGGVKIRVKSRWWRKAEMVALAAYLQIRTEGF